MERVLLKYYVNRWIPYFSYNLESGISKATPKAKIHYEHKSQYVNISPVDMGNIFKPW